MPALQGEDPSLPDDPIGGKIGKFLFEGSELEYHVEGWGTPVLITKDISGRYGSYDWRYIFDCLAGTFIVYALGVIGTPGTRLAHGPRHYARLIEAFIREQVREKAPIITGPLEAAFALQAAFGAPRLVDRVIVVYPDSVARILTHGSLARDQVERALGIPRLEGLAGRRSARRPLCTRNARLFALGKAYDCGYRLPRFRRSGFPPGGMNALRFCDEAVRFLR